MNIGYNTNGWAHHSLPDTLQLLHEVGYRSVALTLDHACLNPYGRHFDEELAATAALLRGYGMRNVIETGARFLLDPRRRHQPTLLAPAADERARRVDFLCRAIDVAAELQSDCVTLWSGPLPAGATRGEALRQLAREMRPVLDRADERGMRLGFEPEPDMLVDTMASFAELLDHVRHPLLKLTLDVGHLHCLGEFPLADRIGQWGPWLVAVHLEDMRVGVHDHLMFGEGEIDFPAVIDALHAARYEGGVYVELSRHSHVAPEAAVQAYRFLQPLIAEASAATARKLP
jgi:sugar phosphate isomerase/epimerase